MSRITNILETLDKDEATFVVKISDKHKDGIQIFRNILNALEKCNTGMSREFKFSWDGDGSMRCKVIDEDGIEPTEPNKDDNVFDGSVIYIGTNGYKRSK